MTNAQFAFQATEQLRAELRAIRPSQLAVVHLAIKTRTFGRFEPACGQLEFDDDVSQFPREVTCRQCQLSLLDAA